MRRRWMHFRRPKIAMRVGPLVFCLGLLTASAALAQSLPTVPGLPGAPGLPGVPGVPGLPGLPNLPGITVNIPGLPSLPGIAGVPSLSDIVTQCGAQPLSGPCNSLLKALPPQLSGAVLNAIQQPKLLSDLLRGVNLGVSTSQQVVTNALALASVQANQQITDFALSGIPDFFIPASETGAVLQSISPTAEGFGISGVSHTFHDGFSVSSGGVAIGQSPEFDTLDAGITLGMRFDASRVGGWPKDFFTVGLFGNYTNSDIDFGSSRTLRNLGITDAGDASLNSGSGGGYALLTNGTLYGLAIGSGQFGRASANDAVLNSHGSFDTSGFSTSLLGGVVVPAWANVKLDLRGGLNYLTTTADNHTDSAGVSFGEGHINEFTGDVSARLFTAMRYSNNTIVRPFLQGGVDYRFDYENEIEVENVNFSLKEGRTTLFGRLGLDFDYKDYIQAYLALRGDHNEDFDTISGQVGLTIKLN